MYSVQALWTAAHENLPVVIAVVNNRQYGILKMNLVESGSAAAKAGRFVGMDLDSPPVDYVGLARSLGVDAQLVEKPADVTEAARAAFEAGRPTLLELPISAAASPEQRRGQALHRAGRADPPPEQVLPVDDGHLGVGDAVGHLGHVALLERVGLGRQQHERRACDRPPRRARPSGSAHPGR